MTRKKSVSVKRWAKAKDEGRAREDYDANGRLVRWMLFQEEGSTWRMVRIVGGKKAPTSLYTCGVCKKSNGYIPVQYSLGIYAGRYHDECWPKAGYRMEGAEGFDPMDAGEAYGEEDY